MYWIDFINTTNRKQNKMLKDIAQSSTANNEETDNIGDGFLWDTGIYKVTIMLAYMDKSRGGATSINFIFKREDGKELRNTIYITNRAGQNFYMRDDKEMLNIGWQHATSLYYAATGTHLKEATEEKKVINIYDFDAKKELPQSRDVLVDLLGKEIILGLHKITEDKNVKNSAGKYVTSGKVRDVNMIDKTFQPSGMTNAEANEGLTAPVFLLKWKDKFGTKTIDKAKGVADESLESNTDNKTTTEDTQSLFE